MQPIISQFIEEISQTTWFEFVAVITGIASVIFSRKENILVYPGWYDQHGNICLDLRYTWALRGRFCEFLLYSYEHNRVGYVVKKNRRKICFEDYRIF